MVKSGTPGTVPEFCSRAHQRLSTNGINRPRSWNIGIYIGFGRIEEHHVVVIFRKRPQDIPPQTYIDAESRSHLHVVLYIRRKVEIAQPTFGRKLSKCGISVAQQETGKGVARRIKVTAVASGSATELKPSTTPLAFVVVLVSATYFPTQIESVPPTRPQPVVY